MVFLAMAAPALFVLWLAWELSYVSQRRAAVAEIEMLGGGVFLAEDLASELASPPSIPVWRHWLGDMTVAQLVLPVEYLGSNENNQRVTALFPETVRPALPPFDVIGKISADELREIWTAATSYCRQNNIHDRLLGVEISKDREVEATFGEIRGPLDGGGTVLDMRKVKGAWIVVSRSPWLS
jgi:hypothetical protein